MTWKNVFDVYIEHPERSSNLDNGTVLYYNEDIVVIRDKYPKAKIHWLLIPRNKKITYLNPLKAYAFDFREECTRLKPYVEEFRLKAAQELTKYLKAGSKLNAENLVKAGLHSVPSCSNIHVHIISLDYYSPSLKNARHYLTFNTEFFVPFQDVPKIVAGDPRLDEGKMELLVKKSNLISVWTKKDFGRSFASLKKHLAEEYEKRFNETISKKRGHPEEEQDENDHHINSKAKPTNKII